MTLQVVAKVQSGRHGETLRRSAGLAIGGPRRCPEVAGASFASACRLEPEGGPTTRRAPSVPSPRDRHRGRTVTRRKCTCTLM